MISAGAETKGFTVGGIVRDCYYLNGGTYAFRGSVALYDAADRSGRSRSRMKSCPGRKSAALERCPPAMTMQLRTRKITLTPAA